MGMCYCKPVKNEVVIEEQPIAVSGVKMEVDGEVMNEENRLINLDEKEVKYFSFAGKRFKVKPCNVYDGDTFSILFIYKDEIIKYRCRCLGYDTPEMKPSLKNPNREKEKEMAKKARDRFIELLNRGQNGLVEVDCGGFDKYGRILVTVYNGVDQKSLNELMVEEGHGIPYNGGTKESFEFASDDVV